MGRNHRNSECVCGCGEVPVLPKSRFLPGHDAKAVKKVKAAIREERVRQLPSELRQYGMDRGLIGTA